MSQDTPTLETTPREKLGTRYSQRLRETGKIPAVVYGHKQGTVHVAVDVRILTGLLHDNAHLINVIVDDKTEPCLIRDIQWDYLGDNIIHVDLGRVDLTEEVEIQVDLQLTGEPKALQATGAVLDHPLTAITVKCLANVIPEKLTHDISELTEEAPLTIADLTLPQGVTATADSQTIIAQIQIMAEVEEETPTETEGEPQVIGATAEDDAKKED